MPLHNFKSVKGMVMRLRGEIVRSSMSPLGSATGHDDIIRQLDVMEAVSLVANTSTLYGAKREVL